MSALDALLVAAVLVGMAVQGALGFGFAFFVAPAAFAAFDPEQAVTLVLLLAIAINSLVLFGERRATRVARPEVAIVIAAALPGMVLGAWLLSRADHELLQLLVGVVVLAGAAVQAFGRAHEATSEGSRRLTEIAGGVAAGALTTSVSVNGPALVLTFTRLGLRGGRLRDSLAAALLGLSLLATPIVLVAFGGGRGLPGGWVTLACVPALIAGHRLGVTVFARLDDSSHHRATLGAAAVAGLLSIGAALLG
jgi:uncharacterized protein